MSQHSAFLSNLRSRNWPSELSSATIQSGELFFGQGSLALEVMVGNSIYQPVMWGLDIYGKTAKPSTDAINFP